MVQVGIAVRTVFFANISGSEPVRVWLKTKRRKDSKEIGEDIKAVADGWPVGPPLCESVTGRKGLWEVQSNLSGGRIARVYFKIHNGNMVLLHGIDKKMQKAPKAALDLAASRGKEVK